MVKEIVKDTLFLSMKSEPADKSDRQTVIDLSDTLRAHEEGCAGLAANMIGVRKTILAVYQKKEILVMINPKITDHSKAVYEAEEGCLSLTGTRIAKRYETIVVEYHDKRFKKRKETFSGYLAEVIQHEMDHFSGIII